MEEVLKLEDITKTFAATVALKDINVGFSEGQIHGLCGENGAGKSTLGKIITGVHKPDSGTITYRGEEVKVESPRDALEMGISMTHQETLFVPEQTVAENISMTSMPTYGNAPLINWRETFGEIQNLLDKLSMNIDSREKMKNLSVAETVLVAVARAVFYSSQVIVLDEPTSAFNFREVQNLFRIMRDLKDSGSTIIFISHRLEEILEISDRVTVLRDGEKVNTVPTSSLNEESLTKMMCGRDLAREKVTHKTQTEARPLLSVEGLGRGDVFQDVSLDVMPGEILSIAGLLGSGKGPFIKAVATGHYETGTIKIKGEEVHIDSPLKAQQLGTGYLPADRNLEGLVPMLSVRENIYLRSPVGHPFFTKKGKETKKAESYSKKTQVKAPEGVKQKVSTLSGGNQQKVLLSRVLATEPAILLLHEPTRGIDVGAKAEIHKLIGDIASKGKGVLICSSETEEVITISDRVMVFRGGTVVKEFVGDDINEESVVKASLTA